MRLQMRAAKCVWGPAREFKKGKRHPSPEERILRTVTKLLARLRTSRFAMLWVTGGRNGGHARGIETNRWD
jgi:hypothetical protein